MFTGFVGQDPIKRELENSLGYHVHFLLRGRSGCGKSDLAVRAAAARGLFDVTLAKDVTASSFNPAAVTHIIEEAHLLDDPELIYGVMTTACFIFCTTEGANLPETLVNRCITLTLQPYTRSELVKIGEGGGYDLPRPVLALIASRSREVPRTMLQYCQRVVMNVANPNNYFDVKEFLTSVGILENGYTPNDLLYLERLRVIGRASLATMASLTQLRVAEIVNEIEPFLLRRGDVEITTRGRIPTERVLVEK